MTLPDLCEHDEEQSPDTHTVQEAVVEVVKEGVEEGRVTCGVGACVELLGSCPEQVMLCLIAAQSTGVQDAAVKIQHILIRAFCQENAIDLLQVHDQVKLTQLMQSCLSQPGKGSGGQGSVLKAPTKAENNAGFDCIMIKYPKQDTVSYAGDMVSEYIKHELMTHAEPYVSLPD